MQLEELMEHFYDQRKREVPYQSNKEYTMDMMRFLDIILTIACSMKYVDGEGEPPVEIENMHLRGVPITGREVITSLQENMLEREERFPLEEIKSIIQKAVVFIEGRVQKATIEIRIKELADKLKLSELERFVFLLAYAGFIDAKYELLFAFLQGDVRMKLPSIRLAVSLYELFRQPKQEEIGRLVQKQGILSETILIWKQEYDSVEPAQNYTLPERIYGWITGNNDMEPEIKPYVSCISVEEEKDVTIIRKEQCVQIQMAVDAMQEEKTSICRVLNLCGKKGNGRHFLLRQALKASDRKGFMVDVAEVFTNVKWEEVLKKIYLEWILSDSIPCFFYQEFQIDGEDKKTVTLGQLQHFLHIVSMYFPFFIWITEEKAEYLLRLDISYGGIEIPLLTKKEQKLFWSVMAKKYPVNKKTDFNLLANQYQMTVKEIRDALWNADWKRRSQGRSQIETSDISNAVKQQSISQMGGCAHRIPVVYTWDDLILLEESKRQLEMICNQMKYKSVVGEEWGFYEKTAYGRGVCALFTGAPGTGKTMAVQVIANELGLNLYRIDLSQLISKYIGETEKNISKVFEKAREIHGLLFFDEADSLFAKRLDVRDSMDRSANAQTAHLLQEIEDYDGLTILATNLAVNIDDAFKRRIQFMVKFALPSEELRIKLWHSILPKKVPCEETLELEFFAKKFELSPSSIKEILTSAAFLAAASNRGMTNLDIIEAVKMNYSKYGKNLTNEEFEYLL